MALSNGVQGSRYDAPTITWLVDGVAKVLTDSVITAVIEPCNGDDARNSDGAFTLVDGGDDGQFTWQFGDNDIADAGDFYIQFIATYDGITEVSRSSKMLWTVEASIIV
jgi:hypothetical protein